MKLATLFHTNAAATTSSRVLAAMDTMETPDHSSARVREGGTTHHGSRLGGDAPQEKVVNVLGDEGEDDLGHGVCVFGGLGG